jgi:hypothetical protein
MLVFMGGVYRALYALKNPVSALNCAVVKGNIEHVWEHGDGVSMEQLDFFFSHLS